MNDEMLTAQAMLDELAAQNAALQARAVKLAVDLKLCQARLVIAETAAVRAQMTVAAAGLSDNPVSHPDTQIAANGSSAP